MNFSRIMVAVDGSEHSAHAVAAAAQLAAAVQGQLTLVYVTYFDSVVSEPPGQVLAWLPEQVAAAVDKASDEVLSKMEQLLPAGMKAEKVALVGQPQDKLLEYANENNVDMLVIGARGLGVLETVFLGSTSQYMLEKASCAVLVVK